MRFLSTFLQINFVAYTLVVLCYALIGSVSDPGVPCSPVELLQLLLETSCVALWTTSIGKYILRGPLTMLGSYAGCVAIVLGLGYWTGLIPAELELSLSVAACVAFVFVGTALYCWLGARASAREINRCLEMRRKEDK